MATDVIADLYASLLTDPACPAQLQHRAYDYGVRHRKPKLLALLAGAPGTGPQLDRLLAEDPQHLVRAAWLSRPGRPVPDILAKLDGENRTTVLTAVAAVAGLPGEVYERISTVPSEKTAVTLLANPSAPLTAKRAAAAVYGLQFSGRYSAQHELNKVFADQQELLDALASRTELLPVIGYAAERAQLTAATVAHAAAVLCRDLDAHDPGANGSWLQVDLMCNAAAHLAGQLTLTDADRARLSRSVMALPAGNRSAKRADAVIALGKRPSGLAPAVSPTAAVRAAATPGELDDAVSLVQRTREPALAAALADNPNCGAGRLAEFITLVPATVASRLVVTRARDVDVLAVLLSENKHLIRDEVFAASGQPVTALAATARRFRETGKPLPTKLGRSEYATADVVAELPVDYLAGKVTLTTSRATTAALLDRLGDTDACWQTFETLAAGFTGNLGNLLTAVTLIEAGDEAPAPEPDTTEHGGPPTLF